MEFIADFGLFLLKSITVVAAILIIIGGIVNASQRNKGTKTKGNAQGEIRLTNLTERYKHLILEMQDALLSRYEAKELNKADKKADKLKVKEDKKKAKQLKKVAPETNDNVEE